MGPSQVSTKQGYLHGTKHCVAQVHRDTSKDQETDPSSGFNTSWLLQAQLATAAWKSTQGHPYNIPTISGGFKDHMQSKGLLSTRKKDMLSFHYGRNGSALFIQNPFLLLSWKVKIEKAVPVQRTLNEFLSVFLSSWGNRMASTEGN